MLVARKPRDYPPDVTDGAPFKNRIPPVAASVLLLAGCFSPTVATDTEAGPVGTTGGATEDGLTGSSTEPVSESSTSTTETAPMGDSSGTAGPQEGSSSGPGSTCGDGDVDADEECDDGNDDLGDGCNPDCRESGRELWSASVHGTEEQAVSLSLRADDHIFVVGRVGPTDAVFSNWWRTYSPDGVALGTGELDNDFLSLELSPGASEREGRIVGVAVDGTGDLFSGFVLRVGALHMDFAEAWSAPLNPLGSSPFPDSFARAIAIGEDGALLVAGGNRQGPSFAGFHRGFARRFSSSGTNEWEDLLTDNMFNPGGSLCFAGGGGSGGYVLLCYDDFEDESEVSMRKFTEAGQFQFEETLEVDTTALAQVTGGTIAWPSTPALSVAPDGSVAVGVPFGAPGPVVEGSEVVVYQPDGAVAWSATLTGSGELWLRDVAFLPDGGTVFVGDTASQDGSGGQDAWIARFDPAGEPLWTDVHNGSGDGDDRYISTKVDSDGNVVVYGEEVHLVTGRDLLIRKLTP